MSEFEQPFTFKRSQPLINASAMLAWYDQNARALPWRTGPADRAAGVKPDPYIVWLSEIMLQQTTVSTVTGYFTTFTKRWPTVFDLAAAERDNVLALWAGLGYYARARNLHACARKIVHEHGGIFPRTAAALHDLPGIGAYTSAAIAAICFDEQIAVVDGNVERVVARHNALPRPVRDTKTAIRTFVQQAVPKRSGDFAQALMDLGATVCTPAHAGCTICPVQSGCAGYRTANPTAFPVAPVRKKKPRRTGHAFVVENAAGEIWLRRRPETGLLAAMIEIPGTVWRPEVAAETDTGRGGINADSDAAIDDWFGKEAWEGCGEVKHVFTHFSLVLAVWRAKSETPPVAEGWWCHKSALRTQALPAVYARVIAAALKK